MLKSKPSGILKKAKLEEEASHEAEPEKLNRQKYEEIIFKFDEEKPSPVCYRALLDFYRLYLRNTFRLFQYWTVYHI